MAAPGAATLVERNGNGDSADEAVVADGEPAAETGTNVWPDATAEAAFIAEQRDQGDPVAVVAASEAGEETESAGTLPALADLVQQIPAETREVVDKLFRAKFTTVKRVPKKSLKA
ncbi:MAG TPA: hypothetical protein PLU52_05205 [Opitutaceae bacterium]|nr:hypothetical protein [Opitutaceae bacterium]